MRIFGKRVDGYDLVIDGIGVLIVIGGIALVIGAFAPEKTWVVGLVAGICLIVAGLAVMGVRGIRKRDRDRPAIDG
jgi:uncharacterized membrane protein YbhN (UPF0104 family)